MSNIKIATGSSSQITLNDGWRMPMFGLGTSSMKDTVSVCVEAARIGYRMFDTANLYGNEAELGEAIHTVLADRALKREDLFVVTKLHWNDHGADKTRAAIEKSLKELRLDYIDLYLVHKPHTGKILETYDTILEYQKKGLIRSVGVSNFGVHHLKGLAEAGRQTPAVNQIELNCFWRLEALVKYCRKNGIVVSAFSPMARSNKLRHPEILNIAQGRGKSAGQIMIRWCVQKGFIPIPKTSSIPRLLENMKVFDWQLGQDDMATLDSLPEETTMELEWPLDNPTTQAICSDWLP